MTFVILGFDGPDGASRRKVHRPAHLDTIAALDVERRVVLAGPADRWSQQSDRHHRRVPCRRGSVRPNRSLYRQRRLRTSRDTSLSADLSQRKLRRLVASSACPNRSRHCAVRKKINRFSSESSIDTLASAEEQVLLKAKRNAVEQSGVYIETISEDREISRGETASRLPSLSIRTIAAAVTETGERPAFYVKIRATVHLDWLLEALKRLKSDEQLADHHRQLHNGIQPNQDAA